MYRVAAVCDIENIYESIGLHFDADNIDRFLAHPMRDWVMKSLTVGIWNNKRKLDGSLGVADLYGIKKARPDYRSLSGPRSVCSLLDKAFCAESATFFLRLILSMCSTL